MGGDAPPGNARGTIFRGGPQERDHLPPRRVHSDRGNWVIRHGASPSLADEFERKRCQRRNFASKCLIFIEDQSRKKLLAGQLATSCSDADEGSLTTSNDPGLPFVRSDPAQPINARAEDTTNPITGRFFSVEWIPAGAPGVQNDITVLGNADSASRADPEARRLAKT